MVKPSKSQRPALSTLDAVPRWHLSCFLLCQDVRKHCTLPCQRHVIRNLRHRKLHADRKIEDHHGKCCDHARVLQVPVTNNKPSQMYLTMLTEYFSFLVIVMDLISNLPRPLQLIRSPSFRSMLVFVAGFQLTLTSPALIMSVILLRETLKPAGCM